jgi:hypothetical protein
VSTRKDRRNVLFSLYREPLPVQPARAKGRPSRREGRRCGRWRCCGRGKKGVLAEDIAGEESSQSDFALAALAEHTKSAVPDEMDPGPRCVLLKKGLGILHGVARVAVGDALPEMPVFLTTDRHVPCPREATYQTAREQFPAPLKGPLESPSTP